ncbi:23S rRNA (adenine(2030)-N(6))-methyltransferase RlmJ [Massilia arenosa]|uniref:Ribosomal RNA large subunit methyltransferase J n=1 Tax=Zemynaea arenosa TaxID=2561931 RepID=A0A4Y9S1Z5_9BURK|nr:23S rRNA (adenine(2030)-N(6))-methyltransferase RlmJ [Massilia arenosa]TFW15374.1 23S rRNA (adenine(2030)-N(6))-methyltransferase RlmJ [Massilia arenosa]
MFSYRHAFHAGNHADVLKHFVLVQLLEYLNQKDTPYTYIDTHSGAGVYTLDEKFAAKTAEYTTGIGKLWTRDDIPAPLQAFADIIHEMNPSGKLRYYPGSPFIAERVARDEDRLRLFEMHPADAKLLADNFRELDAHKAAQGYRPTVRGKRVIIERSDGFASLKALLPPPSRRALVLIDPPYEDKNDYRYVADMLKDSLGRFPAGVYAVWYPILQRIESRQFADKLKRLPCKEWLNVSLTTRTPGPDGALHSSGMFILNPPYTLEPLLREVMPYLVQLLGTDAGATFVIQKGAPVTGAAHERFTAEGKARTPVHSPIGKGSLRVRGQAPAGEERKPASAPNTGTRSGSRAASGGDATTGARADAGRRTSRPAGDRPAGDRPANSRAAGGRPSGDRPAGAGARGPAKPRRSS